MVVDFNHSGLIIIKHINGYNPKLMKEYFITTSNIKKPPRHPMNFKEKVRHMTKMGVKSKYIIEEKTPYVANNLSKKYDKDTTAFVYVFGAKMMVDWVVVVNTIKIF